MALSAWPDRTRSGQLSSSEKAADSTPVAFIPSLSMALRDSQDPVPKSSTLRPLTCLKMDRNPLTSLHPWHLWYPKSFSR